MQPRFVHLHVHSHYSFLHAVGSPAEIVAEAARTGMAAVALTDHLGLWGAVEFYRAARSAGVKPIAGCEVRVPGMDRRRPGQLHHLVLLARDRRGYEDLVGLVSRSFLQAAGSGTIATGSGTPPTGSGTIPTVRAEDLARGCPGLFAIAPTLAGEVGRLILEGDERGAVEAAAAWRDLCGAGRFFLEVSDHGLDAERHVNRALRRLAGRLGIGLVAGNDVHHPREDEARLWALARAAGAGAGRTPRPRAGVRDAAADPRGRPYLAPCRAPLTGEHWLKPPPAMAAAFAEIPEAVDATLAIAEACDLDLPLGERYLPPFPVPPGTDADGYLRRLAGEGLRRRLAGEGSGPGDGEGLKRRAGPPGEYANRLDHELRVIAGRGLATYFLIFWDLCRFAGRQGIPVGPGRGSAAGSLVAYALSITGVDPVRHNLYFERFLNPDRPRLPDIDLDVCMLGRDEIVDYLFRRHGPGRVCHAGTVARFGPRGAVRAAAAALGLDPRLADRLARLLPERTGDAGLAGVLEAWPEFRTLPLDEEPFRTLVAAATHLEGAPRYPAMHPAGFVLGGPELERLIPVHVSPAGEPVSQYAMEDVETLGFLKFDVLGLRNLTIIDGAIRTAGRDALPGLTRDRIPPADPDALDLLARGETVGCFQLESPGMRRLLRAFAPRDVGELAAVLSLYRPGPLDADAVAAFLRRRRGEEPVTVPHPLLEPVLAETYGILLYQEQVMLAAVRVAGFSLGEADGLRRALEHPDAGADDGLAAYRARFLAGAEARGLACTEAERVFSFLERFAGYSFCKAHSTAYALISYWTVFLKARCPAHYFAALLTTQTGYYAPWVYVAEARRAGAPILPPDINLSTAGFEAEPAVPADPGALAEPVDAARWGIRPGLLAVRGVGVRLARRILEERLRDGPFRSLDNVASRLGQAAPGMARAALPGALETLVQAGFLDELGERRDLSTARRMALEEQALGWSWSGPLLAPHHAALEGAGVTPSTRLGALPNGERVSVAGRVATARRQRTRSGAPFLFLLLHDGEGMIEVTVPPDRYLRLFRQIDPAGVLVRGRLAGDGADAGGVPHPGLPHPGRPPLPRRLVAEEVIPLTEVGNDPV